MFDKEISSPTLIMYSEIHTSIFEYVQQQLGMVHSVSSGKGKMFLCAACHAFTPHVNAWKNLIGIVVQIQARG